MTDEEKLEGLLREAAELSKSVDPAASTVIHTLIGSMCCDQTPLFAAVSADFARIVRDLLIEELTARQSVQ